MEINSIANFATTARKPDTQGSQGTQDTEGTVGLAVQKKASEIQAATASAMIESLPPATPASKEAAAGSKPSYNLPPNLGKHINTTA
jgi:hypothetical protein